MPNKFLLVLALFLYANHLMAQHISPIQLLKMNGYWQMNDPSCVKLTHDYLMTIDTNWGPNQKEPLNDQNSCVLSFGYSKDRKVWYQQGECSITMILDRPTNHKSLTYAFTEMDTWAEYNKQMGVMNAIRL